MLDEAPKAVRYFRNHPHGTVAVATLIGQAMIVLIAFAILGLGVAIVPIVISSLAR
jgi:hypothetical protein